MKKTLIALAVLAASGATMAQSTVTLYGIADANIGQTRARTSVTNAAAVTQTTVSSGTINGSRWGLKGTEDLGGGLKAVFQLESGFSIDTGASAQGGTLFSRQAFVGVSTGFGALTLGRQYSAYDTLRAGTNNTYDSLLATTGDVFNGTGIVDYTARIDNSIAFTSNNYSGFSGALVAGLGENKLAGVDASSNISLNLMYSAGPLMVGYAHQSQKAQNATLTGTDTTKFNLFAGSYDFGMAKLLAGYQRAELNGAKDNEYQLGVNVPVGPAASVAFGYTKSKAENTAGNTIANGTGVSLAGLYDLSKRTAVYAGLSKNTSDLNDGGDYTVDSSKAQVGIRHKF